MNRHFLKFIILASAACAALSACNSSEQEEMENVSKLASSTLVKSFSLNSNYKLMAKLDSVFFSIDQVKAEIFNADSLPWGTDVRKLTVNVGLPSTGSLEIIMPKLSDGTDTVIDLQQNPTDSINFSHGRVWLRVGSNNGDFQRIYTVKVNVHQCNPDSLQWDTSVSALPSTLATPLRERTVELNGTYYSLTRNASALQLSTTTDPASKTWTHSAVTSLPADVDVHSLTASTDALYILTGTGALLTSTDGIYWQQAQEGGWSHLYGGFGSDVVGVKGSQWATYPGGRSGEIPAEMPVKATSPMWSYSSEWAIEPQAIFVGGTTASGAHSGHAWGFDGERWMQLSGRNGRRALPEADNMQLFPYFTFIKGNRVFFTNRQSAWIAFGGRLADGSVQKKVYVSLDNGLNWREGSESIQLPKEIAPRWGASVVLCEKTFTVNGSRAVKPITEWDAPYIYLIGGHDASGRLFDQTWCGVINRLTFRPLQ